MFSIISNAIFLLGGVSFCFVFLLGVVFCLNHFCWVASLSFSFLLGSVSLLLFSVGGFLFRSVYCCSCMFVCLFSFGGGVSFFLFSVWALSVQELTENQTPRLVPLALAVNSRFWMCSVYGRSLKGKRRLIGTWQHAVPIHTNSRTQAHTWRYRTHGYTPRIPDTEPTAQPTTQRTRGPGV